MTPVLSWSAWSLTALLAAALLAGKLVRWSAALGAIDVPNARSSHALVTPRGGGLAIVAVAVAAAAIECCLHPAAMPRILGALAPAVIVAFVSWLDDVRSLSQRLRFGVHLACAVVATAALGPVRSVDLGLLGRIDFGVAAWPLTLLWITGLTNAFNFMDGIDGIAGVTAVVVAAAVSVTATALGSPAVGGSAAALAAAAGGFLTCNWQPARIFMGDVGSAFCGFLLGTLPLALPADAVPIALPAAAAALWPFIFDTASTILRRLYNRENVLQAHRQHLYQRLVIAGWSHRSVASMYGLLSAVCALPVVLPIMEPQSARSAIFALPIVVAGSAVILVSLVTGAERAGERSADRAPGGRRCSTRGS